MGLSKPMVLNQCPNKNNWWNEAVKATKVVEAVEVIEAAEVLRPGKSLLRTSESSRFLNCVFIWCFENIFILVESWNIMLNFSTFSIGGCWGQPMLLFWNLVNETQISNPPEPAMHHNSKKDKYWSFYPSEPFTLYRFTMRHPVGLITFSQTSGQFLRNICRLTQAVYPNYASSSSV